jgi:hypothetical protein
MSVHYYHKWMTIDCDKCPCKIEDKCCWGTYAKILSTGYSYGEKHKMKHCEFVGRPPVHPVSFWVNQPAISLNSVKSSIVESKPTQGKLF